MNEPDKQEYEKVISSYYGDDQVSAIISLKVDTKDADKIASQVASLDNIIDLFLVTGDTDILAKAKFASYGDLKNFVLNELSGIDGIKETKTLMIVTTFKEGGKLVTQE